MDGKWRAYRIGGGLRLPVSDLLIPSEVKAKDLVVFLDDIFHEKAAPGDEIREMGGDAQSSSSPKDAGLPSVPGIRPRRFKPQQRSPAKPALKLWGMRWIWAIPKRSPAWLNRFKPIWGGPEILVTNAGGSAPGTLATTPLDQYEKGITLNLMSAVHLIHAVVPAMQKKKWGRIIAIPSTSVKQPIDTLLLSNTARAGSPVF